MFVVYTRSFFEDEYLFYFIEHYLRLGFDKIIILKTDDLIFKLDDNHKDKVEIHYVENIGNDVIRKYDYLIRKEEYDWILVVDSDEFLILNKNYKSIKDFVNKKLIRKKNINAFRFYWGLVEKYDIENNNKLNYILENYYIKKSNTFKMLFKVKDLISVHVHRTKLRRKIISIDKYYKETIIIHLHTRSINNIITKSFYTVLKNKRINNKENFISFINNNKEYDNILNNFKLLIGTKATLPYGHNKNQVVNTNNFDFTTYDFNIVDPDIEKKSILKLITDNNINKENYFNFIQKLNDKIISDKTFIIQ